MSSDGGKRARGRVLHPDEVSLWKRVTESVVPVDERQDNESFEDMMRQVDLPQTPRPRVPVSAHDRPGVVQRQVPAKPALPTLGTFDSRQSRQISRGNISIDDVLDLHGLRQDEAHRALKRFLVVSQAHGARYVTVITGKGRRRDVDADALWDEREYGVLRRMVRGWLEEPEFRSVVVSYMTAPRNHGGDGALFVHIRRANRPSRNR